eukprot:CAMPEP_0203756388 /NCGR_PEP_ID=MMETSP0098-20131031/9690_1 /ASSEMBLY_ACC=CAM_ASM_000208 /TAXON_ID=96639 /ORGANISM=" , Strain NY0313808BC1" /LENGTH=423 /DNA_ID=CAMNT_0050648261 /DNA_START=95 /DNA_END=1366 /DNA_ORIENTATION=+
MANKWGHLFTKRSSLRQPSAIRALMPYLSRPGTISLGGGMPNSSTFPIAGIKIELKDGSQVSVANVDQALQYSGSNGISQFVEYLDELQRTVHKHPHAEEQSILVSTGSQDALTKTFDLFLDQGDSLLLEEFTYSGSLAYLAPMDLNLVSVKTDSGGILPSSLDSIMKNWSTAGLGKKKPRILYTIPTGSNPTGISIDLQRRKDLYAVAKKHDLLILEDDPYYYLQFGEKRQPSLYSMDTDDRVIRFDSFSKVLSSGLRLGFVTGPKQVVDQLNLHMQSTSLHTSGVSQSVALALCESWKEKNNGEWVQGFEKHLVTVVDFYRKQRSLMSDCLDRHLAGLCEWKLPDAGMFVWVKMPDGFSTAAFAKMLVEVEGVLVVAGQNFSPSGEDIPYIRLSFSTASKESMDEALSRFANMFNEVYINQ